MDLRHRAGQHVLGDQQEVGILALLDAATLVLEEHLTRHVDGQGRKSLFAGEELFRPLGLGLLWIIDTRHHDLHDAEGVVRSTTECREVGV